jgi:hypothetical protein
MANKQKNSQKFYCPHCQKRLWRLGSPKYYDYVQSSENKICVNYNAWLEQFLCEEHDRLWL